MVILLEGVRVSDAAECDGEHGVNYLMLGVFDIEYLFRGGECGGKVWVLYAGIRLGLSVM